MGDVSQCVPSSPDGNVGLAFGIVTAAGLSTTIGAALAFVIPYSRSSKNLFLAACLAIAAGVMIYVSFVEIFSVKTVDEFSKCFDSSYAYLYATLCFFGGIAITAIFDGVLHHFQHRIFKQRGNQPVQPQHSQKRQGDKLDSKKKVESDGDFNNPNDPVSDDNQCSSDTSSTTERVNVEQGGHDNDDEENDNNSDIQVDVTHPAATDRHQHELDNDESLVGHGGHLIASLYTNNNQDRDEDDTHHDTTALIRMGIFAGIALAFHNFPEGLATFVSVLEDPSVGVSVAIAIAIHNIPEGVCVAMPIYYATGSRLKAFFWATLSGMTELVGAFLGWVVLRNVITPTVYAMLFGIVGGMMVYISFKELIPTAHRYDKDDQVTSLGIVIGMIIMALSLVLFQF